MITEMGAEHSLVDLVVQFDEDFSRVFKSLRSPERDLHNQALLAYGMMKGLIRLHNHAGLKSYDWLMLEHSACAKGIQSIDIDIQRISVNGPYTVGDRKLTLRRFTANRMQKLTRLGQYDTGKPREDPRTLQGMVQKYLSPLQIIAKEDRLGYLADGGRFIRTELGVMEEAGFRLEEKRSTPNYVAEITTVYRAIKQLVETMGMKK